jgi:hypothetical protein
MRAKATNKTMVMIPLIIAPVYSRSLPIVQRVFSCHVFSCPCSADMAQLAIVSLIASLILIILALLPFPASAWNIPGHMLSGVIAYQVLQWENPRTIEKVKAVLEKHPWYVNQMAGEASRRFLRRSWPRVVYEAARWPGELRITDRQHHRGMWHYINWPFKPEGQLASVEIREPEPVNILTALTENERVVKKEADSVRRAIALAWLFHLVGDIHQPLHTAQIFTVDYPNGDRGGNEICIRVTQTGNRWTFTGFGTG